MRTLAIVLVIGFFITDCGGGAGKAISGKFLLFEHPKDADAPDAIEFRVDGSCIVDSGERSGIPGKYHAYPNGSLTINADTGTQTEYTYNYQLLKYTLVLSKDDKSSLFYVRLPEGPHPRFAEIVGVFYSHSDLGDSAGEITADHKFRDHLQNLVPEEHAYYDINMDGVCSYSNGVVTYVPEHSNAPQQDKYLRDFIVKRDASGLWVVDPFHDAVLCEKLATNFDLPPPPSGYQKGDPSR
jgi:hypothetical protein